MTQQPLLRLKPFILFLITMLSISLSQAQKYSKIDWSKDTISVTEAKACKDTYLKMVRGSGQKNATEQIMLPVDKLKDVMDACAANNVTEVAVMIISLRQNDCARYHRNNPESTASDDDLKGSQMLVFKVPREAFAGELDANNRLPKSNPLMMSLMAAGLIVLDSPYADLPAAGGSVFLTFGKICPPPATCN